MNQNHCPICNKLYWIDGFRTFSCPHTEKQIIEYLFDENEKLINGLLQMKRTLKQLDRKFYSYDDAEWVMDGIDDILRKVK